MLCEYLWKEEADAEKRKNEPPSTKEEGEDGDDEKKEGEPGLAEEAGKESDDDVKREDEEEEGIKSEGGDEADAAGGPKGETSAEEGKAASDDDKEGENAAAATTYSSYVSSYCLRYVRTYFNSHIDDPWFRTRYSPLEKRRATVTERERASEEASTLMEDVEESLRSFREGGGGNGDEGDVCDFVRGARLGNGVKPSGGTGLPGERTGQSGAHAGSGGANSHAPRKRKYSSDKSSPHYASRGANLDELLERDGGLNSVPPSHLHAPVRRGALLKVMDVPPHVTDEQLSFALGEHCDGSKEGGVRAVFSGPVACTVENASGGGGGGAAPTYDELKGGAGDASSGEDPLYRTAWAVFGTEAARDKMITNLTKANVAANRHRGDSRDSTPKVLELDVDCTDPYGRYEIDHDAKGGAPPAEDFESDDEGGPGGNKEEKKDVKDKGGAEGAGATTTQAKAAPRLPLRRSTVFVSTSSVAASQPISVLSAAVSSSDRISKDRMAAVVVARALDSSRGILRGVRLDDVLEKLFFIEGRDEDVLDVSVAYLRRVHLFSFYNGCTASDSMGGTLGGGHTSGTIHLRLEGADDILKKAEEERTADGIYDDLPDMPGAEKKEEEDKEVDDEDDEEKEKPASTDMLVMRLDQSIERAMAKSKSNSSSARTDDSPDVIVDPVTDRTAKQIEFLENQAKKQWVDNHAIIDGDGRARCSFHFCRKLFKDKTFLQKHLHKKHPEFLRAEAGKCHDMYMMRCWDAESDRPVPPILVDCGSKFGLIPSAVIGAEEPKAEDPEPDLWRREQERLRRIEEEEELRRERRAAHEAARAAEERRRGRGRAQEEGRQRFRGCG